jgi:hypothetical protein
MLHAAVYHVAPRLGRWAVEEEGSYPAATCSEKATAVRLAQELARSRHALLVVHRDDGSVHAEHHY